MDAKIFGPFIAERRKELGLTQAQLAKLLHVTDKAVSRWERGVGLPDINSLEALGEALELSLVELMQAKREERVNISVGEAEKIVFDTIHMKMVREKRVSILGRLALGSFFATTVFLLYLLFTEGSIVMYSVGSLVTGFAAWGIPIWRMTYHHKGNTGLFLLLSMGMAFVSIAIQFMEIKRRAFLGDFSAILDTIRAVILVVVLFFAITVGLNYRMMKKEERM